MEIKDLNFDLILAFAPGMLLTAAFCYGLMLSLRQVKPLEKNVIFQGLLPVLPGLLGAAQAALVPFFWPPTSFGARLVLGATAGLHMGALFAIIKRIMAMTTGKLEAKLGGSEPPAAVEEKALPAGDGGEK